MKPFFISIPHAGEEIPQETPWLQGKPEPVLMCDVDRYVDRLYESVIKSLNIPLIKTRWHRYVVDLNRLETDIDARSVEGHANPEGMFPLGLHWVKTTRDHILLPQPMSRELHELLVKKYFRPFHDEIKRQYATFKGRGHDKVYHLDAHSMPSQGTAAHRDPGTKRPEIVVSDYDGRSCESRFKDLVIEAYKSAGFDVAYNWPYKGGRVTQTYGQPAQGQHAIQVELNRSLYMDEVTKQPSADFSVTQKRLESAVRYIFDQL